MLTIYVDEEEQKILLYGLSELLNSCGTDDDKGLEDYEEEREKRQYITRLYNKIAQSKQLSLFAL